MALFEVSTSVSRQPQTESLIPKCGACGLNKTCVSPKIQVSGGGNKGILIVGSAPGEAEDSIGENMTGPTRKLLAATLATLDHSVDLDRDCWLTNSLICKLTRKPKVKEIDHCRPNFLQLIKRLQPRVIIPLGADAIRTVIGYLWNEKIGEQERWIGWKIPAQKINAWVVPTWHPEYVIQSREEREGPVIRLWWRRHLERALSLENRPWDVVPDYAKQVRVVVDPSEAAVWLQKRIELGGAVAFDYETTCLKPDNPAAEIVSCSVCWQGKETIAYPWVGEAITATSDLLRSDLPKLGANKRFEESWSRKFLGHGVNNWKWDCVQAAHNLDCREGITSVKFQAFVRCGVPSWGDRIKPFLKFVDDSGVNSIRKVDLRSLLIYNGIDSLVEYLVAGLQRKESRGEVL